MIVAAESVEGSTHLESVVFRGSYPGKISQEPTGASNLLVRTAVIIIVGLS